MYILWYALLIQQNIDTYLDLNQAFITKGIFFYKIVINKTTDTYCDIFSVSS